MNVAYDSDCLAAMREMPDNAFDLAVVDPPYGNGLTNSGGCKGWFEKYRQDSMEQYNRFGNPGSRFEKYKQAESGVAVSWDVAPPQEYFNQLFRVSRNQIIWGGNYFQLPPTRCFLVWRKTNIPSDGFSMAAVEYAWTSFSENARVFEYSSMNQQGRFHPTQKPIELYEWIYKHFAKDGDKILDTHLGSGSSRIAAYLMGFDFVGYEIDETYFQLQEERFARYSAQMNLFID